MYGLLILAAMLLFLFIYKKAEYFEEEFPRSYLGECPYKYLELNKVDNTYVLSGETKDTSMAMIKKFNTLDEFTQYWIEFKSNYREGINCNITGFDVPIVSPVAFLNEPIPEIQDYSTANNYMDYSALPKYQDIGKMPD